MAFYADYDSFNVWGVLRFDFDQRYVDYNTKDSYLTRATRWHVFWTLPLEIGYYFLIPIYVGIIAFSRRFGWILNSLALMYVVPTSISMVRTHHQGLWPNLHIFLTGSIFGIMHTQLQSKSTSSLPRHTAAHSLSISTLSSKRKSVKRMIVDGIGYIAVLFLASQVTDRFLYSWILDNPFPKTGDFPRFTAPLTGFIILKELHYPSLISQLFDWWFFKYCGKISFSLYLWHSFPARYWNTFKKDTFDTVIFVLSVSFVMATLSFYLIEEPMMDATECICKYLKTFQSHEGGGQYCKVDAKVEKEDAQLSASSSDSGKTLTIAMDQKRVD